MPRNYSRTRAWGCAANAGGWLPAQTDVMSWCPVNGTSGVLTVMMHGDREDNPIPEMLPNAGTNPDNIITTISGIGNDGGDW